VARWAALAACGLEDHDYLGFLSEQFTSQSVQAIHVAISVNNQILDVPASISRDRAFPA